MTQMIEQIMKKNDTHWKCQCTLIGSAELETKETCLFGLIGRNQEFAA